MPLRDIPSVEQLLQQAGPLAAEYGRPLLTRAIRETLQAVRENVQAGGVLPSHQNILDQVLFRLVGWTQATLEPVINATGVILHTNLGRAPLSGAATQAMQAISMGYSTLEFDLQTGKRGSRLIHAGQVLKELTGAEDAMVVNNCASAVLLVLAALAKNKKVIIPRSQLVEIGGGFRVPDVMKQSGAKLVEIGTTNKLHLRDVDEALEENPGALVMRAHRSNFRLVGFTEEPGLAEMVAAAHQHGAVFLDDLGSGALLDVEKYGLSHEPTVQESLAAGADVIMFSGDKLLGGPQAGIILGRAVLIEKIRRHPLARAVRADKACLAALAATLLHYLKDEAEREIPIWRMVSAPLEQLKARAEAWQRETGLGEVVPGESTIGGGSLPGETLPTFVLSIPVSSPDKMLAKLRRHSPPVIARTENDRLLFDPRTVTEEQGEMLVKSLKLELLETQ